MRCSTLQGMPHTHTRTHAPTHTRTRAHTRKHTRKQTLAATRTHAHAPRQHRSARFAVQLDNVGFNGDFEAGFGACSYTNYQAREWNTPSINAYPLGGMTSLTDAMRASAEVCCTS
jgi:hypothetical protein